MLLLNISVWGGTGKLRSFWEDKVHIVFETSGESTRVQAENYPNGKTRILHRNMLQTCDDLLDNLTKKG